MMTLTFHLSKELLLLLDFHRSLKIITVDIAKYRMMAFIEPECLIKRIVFPSIFFSQTLPKNF